MVDALNNPDLLTIFRESSPLPSGYGYRLDARVVEIPWLLSRLDTPRQVVLDAGSALNTSFVVNSPIMSRHKLVILTLAPESEAFWRRGISYIFDDLRHLPFKDGWFDAVACISTIEHVGMDNSRYSAEDGRYESQPDDYLAAVGELKRVLKPGGHLYISFPFGKYEDHGWFQQLDAQRADALLGVFKPTIHEETIFQYLPDGWVVSNRAACAQCSYFDVHTSKYFDPNSDIEFPDDFPAAERAVACLKLQR
jgi:SAM-dependent methyltransferase